ncbi:hypothetical protein MMC18_000683 [Xylographa bjoerkii]|nr:hypothetical protein [Xylographa bjoerkii]
MSLVSLLCTGDGQPSLGNSKLIYFALQKLQREIANARGVSLDQIVPSPIRAASNDDYRHGDLDNDGVGDKHDNRRGGGRGGKRKYRRHPKPDENAPERPPSAYVIFSNKCREELKPQNLSFTSIAKLVGERWQALAAGQKEPFETQATSLKETYNSELGKYRRTSGYKEYLEYLADFKAKNANSSTGMESKTKRPKIDTHDSTESSGSANSRHGSVGIPTGSHRRRLDSAGSGTVSPVLAVPLPLGLTAKSPSPASLSPMTFSSHSSPKGNRLTGLSTPSTVDGTLSWTSEISTGAPLPRIRSLDDQEIPVERGRLPPLMTDTSQLRSPEMKYAHPRRPNNHPASLLSTDSRSSISSSSRSSNISNSGAGTAVSSLYSPITSHEESRSPRALPPLSTIASGGLSMSGGGGKDRTHPYQPATSQPSQAYISIQSLSNAHDSSSASGRCSTNEPFSWNHPLYKEHDSYHSSRESTTDYDGIYPDIPVERRSLMRLSLAGTAPEARYDPRERLSGFRKPENSGERRPSLLDPGLNPLGRDWQQSPLSLEQRYLPPTQEQKFNMYQDEDLVDSHQSTPMDGLSVLALAGRMIDRDTHRPP